jgi:hypothetical protein
MAEVGLIASLVSIAGAAVQLTRTLYAFGSTTSAAREHVDHIAKNVSFYSGVLELLVEQFGNDRPILLHPITSLSAYLSFHTIKHHKTSTFSSTGRLSSYREAPHERNSRSGETQHPFIGSDLTMALMIAIETPTTGVAKGY